jgi:putative transposase
MAKDEKVSAEVVVRDIRRQTRRKYSAEEKIRIVLEGLRGEDTLDRAVATTGVTQVALKHRPHLLSDNGPAYLSAQLADYLQAHGLRHTRGQPFHPMTQAKIERCHRSLKNVIYLENHYFPWQLEQAIAAFVDYYNHRRYHEALRNVTPADVFFRRAEHIQDQRTLTKHKTLAQRRAQHLLMASSA